MDTRTGGALTRDVDVRWTYEQSTGRLWRGAEVVATGYSGFGDAKNRPECEGEKDRGPIPAGLWRIGPPFCSDTHGPFVLPLLPLPGTNTYGRSGFLVHGDSIRAPGTASHGCIIQPHDARVTLWESGERVLEVVASRVAEAA